MITTGRKTAALGLDTPPHRQSYQPSVLFHMYFIIYLFILFLAASSLKLRHAGSFIVMCRLFSNCGAWTQWCGMRASLPHSMWDLSSPTRG